MSTGKTFFQVFHKVGTCSTYQVLVGRVNTCTSDLKRKCGEIQHFSVVYQYNKFDKGKVFQLRYLFQGRLFKRGIHVTLGDFIVSIASLGPEIKGIFPSSSQKITHYTIKLGSQTGGPAAVAKRQIP